jgi:hypothetical protein
MDTARTVEGPSRNDEPDPFAYLYFRNDQSTNSTRVGITGNGDGSHDYRLTGLRKYTQYSIVVKAFNSKGDGPGSEPVMAHTFEDGEWKKSSLPLPRRRQICGICE